MYKILSFDVSNNSCSVAVSKGQDIIAFEQEMCPSMQAERLFVMIESTLKRCNLSYKDLDYLAVTKGPGSFTGIRIGLAAARGILMASSNIRGLGVTNFEMLHYRAIEQYKKYDKVAILIDAYRNQLYFQEFDIKGKDSLPKLINVDDIPELLKGPADKVICAGSGLLPIYHKLKKMPNLILLPRFSRIKALHICRYADEKIRARQFSPIEPLYIRLPDAIPATKLYS